MEKLHDGGVGTAQAVTAARGQCGTEVSGV